MEAALTASSSSSVQAGSNWPRPARAAAASEGEAKEVEVEVAAAAGEGEPPPPLLFFMPPTLPRAANGVLSPPRLLSEFTKEDSGRAPLRVEDAEKGGGGGACEEGDDHGASSTACLLPPPPAPPNLRRPAPPLVVASAAAAAEATEKDGLMPAPLELARRRIRAGSTVSTGFGFLLELGNEEASESEELEKWRSFFFFVRSLRTLFTRKETTKRKGRRHHSKNKKERSFSLCVFLFFVFPLEMAGLEALLFNAQDGYLGKRA